MSGNGSFFTAVHEILDKQSRAAVCILSLSPSSIRLGRRPLKPLRRVQIPLVTPCFRVRQFERVLNYVPIAFLSGAKGVIFAPFLFAKTCSIFSCFTPRLLMYLAVVFGFLCRSMACTVGKSMPPYASIVADRCRMACRPNGFTPASSHNLGIMCCLAVYSSPVRWLTNTVPLLRIPRIVSKAADSSLVMGSHAYSIPPWEVLRVPSRTCCRWKSTSSHLLTAV